MRLQARVAERSVVDHEHLRTRVQQALAAGCAEAQASVFEQLRELVAEPRRGASAATLQTPRTARGVSPSQSDAACALDG